LTPVYREPETDRLNQGDVLVGVPFVGQDANDRGGVTEMLGLVTAHSCDCDKFFEARRKDLSPELLATWPILVAPAHPPELLIGGQAGDARKGRMPRYFPIPTEDERPELVVDLWREQAVPAVILERLDRQGSLSAEMIRRFYIHLWTLRTRIKPETVFKPEALG
jgi:hypothetical protein